MYGNLPARLLAHHRLARSFLARVCSCAEWERTSVRWPVQIAFIAASRAATDPRENRRQFSGNSSLENLSYRPSLANWAMLERTWPMVSGL